MAHSPKPCKLFNLFCRFFCLRCWHNVNHYSMHARMRAKGKTCDYDAFIGTEAIEFLVDYLNARAQDMLRKELLDTTKTKETEYVYGPPERNK